MTTETTKIRSSNPLTLLLTSKFFIFVLRLFLGGLFLYSSLQKVQHPDQFAVAVRAYKMLPLGLTSLFALAIAWGEAVAGILLIVGLFTRQAAGAVFLLLASFTIAIVSTQVRGMVVDCGCFSNEGGHGADYTLVVRNLFLLTAAAMVMLFDRGFLALSSLVGKRS